MERATFSSKKDLPPYPPQPGSSILCKRARPQTGPRRMDWILNASKSSSIFQNVTDGISTRLGASLLVESSLFEGSGKAIYSADGSGSVAVDDVDLGGGASTAPAGEMSASDLPYPYEVLGRGAVKQRIVGQAGQTLNFMEGSFDL
jgi:hypothetical protein